MKQKKRIIALAAVCGAMFLTLAVRLINIQLHNGQEYYIKSQEGKIKVLRLAGTRGTITDRNGIPLAYDQKSYNVEFVKDPSEGKSTYPKYTESIRKTIALLEKNGIKINANFAIRKSADGSMEFYWSGVTGEAAAAREAKWRENMYVNKEDPPEILFEELKQRYGIPATTPYEEAYKILSVWQDVQLTRYMSYNPITIAENVDLNTVAEIEMRGMDLTGMQISESTVRVYPKQTMAAHIVGYIGRMTDEGTMLRLEQEGYLRTDLIGISGIEYTMESELTPNIALRTGKQIIEVNNLGKAVRQTDLIEPTSGNNVFLTLDLGLQKVLEEALEQNIKNTYAEQMKAYRENQAKYDTEVAERGGAPLQLAQVGAAVVVDVHTMEILAMCSYPPFDPNIFTGGLTAEEFETLFHDPRNPLFNNAISSSGAPGSIFKMVTGVAGLMEGVVTLDEQIDDKGNWPEGSDHSDALHCWIYPYYYLHKDQNLELAIKNSCNYYFYTIADRLGNSLLGKWTELFGLTTKTNVELLGEKAGQMASQSTLYTPGTAPSGTSKLVYLAIVNLLKDACAELNMTYEDSVYEKVALDLMALVDMDKPGTEIRRILRSELNIPLYYIRSATQTRLDWDVNDFITQIKWNRTANASSGIGQSVTLLTPIGVARYISAIVNGGKVYDATLIKDIVTPDGESIMASQTNLVRDLDIPEEYLTAVMNGMHGVISGEDGTAADEFANFKYQDDVGGKTGTAQVSTIDLENNSWFVAYAPFESPEIAVVVYIPHGYKGILSSYTAREVIEYYLDKKSQPKEVYQIPQPNTIVP